MPKKSRGFTLLEVLVAAGLIGIVMTMAITAFADANKIANRSRSRFIARDEAAKGVQQITDLLRRAHIIYYAGRPLATNHPITAIPTRTSNPNGISTFPAYLPIPEALGSGSGALAPTGDVRYNFSSPADRDISNGLLYKRSRFRFWDNLAGGSEFFTIDGDRLRTNEPAPNPYDRYFSSPLVYFAEANFRTVPDPVSGTIRNSHLPVSWTIHVLYLAPMVVNQNSPEIAFGDERGPGGWLRSTIPFELRLLTIPGVETDTDTNPVTDNRRIDPSLQAGNETLLQVPFDYSNLLPTNYDPVRIPYSAGETDFLDPAGQVKYNYLDSAGNLATPLNASGRRVAGSGIHPNYNNIGNDPPTQQVLTRARVGAPSLRPVTDRAITRYIDPDSVHGTCVRLLNAMYEDNHQPRAGKLYRRYLNAYGVGFEGEGSFLYNTYCNVMQDSHIDNQWDLSRGGQLPRRALVSVTTRYRTNRNIPFQFNTESAEVDLEGVVNFQQVDRRSRL